MAIEGYGKNVIEAQEEPITEEEKKNLYRMNEKEALAQLMEAASFTRDESEYQPIEITRHGKTLIRFTIRPLLLDEFNQCRQQSTIYVKNKQLGMRISDGTNIPEYHGRLIYKATIPEDRELIWDNKAAWKQLDVVSGYQLIGKVLKAGEIDAIISKLNEISGYSNYEEMAKN